MTSQAPAACVIGYPAKHSRSPKMHRHWLQRYGIEGDYRAEEIEPERCADFINNLRAEGYVGANVTMPFKEIALELSRPDARAEAVGAANTLWFEGDRLCSTNTDIEGFQGALDAASPGWDQKIRSAVVVGAGGAGRAVVYGLIERGVQEIHVVNRTLEKAQAMAERFGDCIKPASMEALSDLLQGATLLVNSTSLGMKDQPAFAPDTAVMASGAIVADIVYVPLKTPLLAQAEAQGFAIANGLDMLLHQAVRGFELWFGRRPEVTKDLYDLLAADITG